MQYMHVQNKQTHNALYCKIKAHINEYHVICTLSIKIMRKSKYSAIFEFNAKYNVFNAQYAFVYVLTHNQLNNR